MCRMSNFGNWKRNDNGQVVERNRSSLSLRGMSVLFLTSLLVMEHWNVCCSFSTNGDGRCIGIKRKQPNVVMLSCQNRHTKEEQQNKDKNPTNETISSLWNSNNWNRQQVLKQCGSFLTKSSLFYTTTTTVWNPQTAAGVVKEDEQLIQYMKERVISPNVSQMANIGGLQVSDIFYPSWFKGVWDVSSKTIDITAPCGPTLFGGMYQSTVEKEVGQSIQYKARFVSSNDDTIIADREYNVQSIVTATMSSSSNNNDGSPIMDIRLATPHLFTCYLGGNAFRVDMLESQRAQSSNTITTTTTKEDDDVYHNNKDEFICSEIVQQIVTSTQQQQQRIKLVETTTIYQLQMDGSIIGNQKTFTYLVPSQDDMIALQQWQQAKNRAIDVRTYQVTYKKSTNT